MRISPAEGRLENPVHDIQRQVRAQLESTPDPRLGTSQFNPDTEDPDVGQRRPPQLPALWLTPLLRRCRTERREVTDKLTQVIELGAADHRLKASEQFISAVVVWAHEVGLCAAWLHRQDRSAAPSEVDHTSCADATR
jgi:hypothetical protein